MKKITGLLSLALLFSACTEFIAELDADKAWKLTESDHIKLYYKKTGASGAPSPSKEQVQVILDNQKYYYQAIQDSIQKTFSEPVLIYLYNKDQAKEAIGTSGGGLSQSRYMTIYYTFIHDIESYTDQYGIENPFVGAHEMVHIITHNVLGNPGTKMMSEGYAVWLDGSYGRKNINYYIRRFKTEYPEYVMTPTQLLNESFKDEMIYYPNAGVLIRYWVKQFGIEKINKLFPVSRENFKKKFEEVTETSWDEMESRYSNYLNGL
ncbi:MAG: hypothetical protein ACQESM_09065 [Bacteroidota bacterium]